MYKRTLYLGSAGFPSAPGRQGFKPRDQGAAGGAGCNTVALRIRTMSSHLLSKCASRQPSMASWCWLKRLVMLRRTVRRLVLAKIASRFAAQAKAFFLHALN
eukprot:1007533-Pyramimonas_sp.AAC.1